MLQAVAGFVAAVGVALMVQGGLALLAGVGVLRRRQWGRALGILVAVLAVVWGLLFLAGSRDGGAAGIALGIAQVLYGVFALVVLIRQGAEFSRLWD